MTKRSDSTSSLASPRDYETAPARLVTVRLMITCADVVHDGSEFALRAINLSGLMI